MPFGLLAIFGQVDRDLVVLTQSHRFAGVIRFGSRVN